MNEFMELLRDGPIIEITLTTENGWPITVNALVDTGASSSSIDEMLADFIGVEYTGTVVRVRNANGVTKRKRCYLRFDCDAGIIQAPFTVSDRGNLASPVIIGRNVIFHEEE